MTGSYPGQSRAEVRAPAGEGTSVMAQNRATGRKRAEVAAYCAMAAQFLFFAITLLLGFWCHSRAVRVEAWHLFAGIPFWLLIAVHIHQKRVAGREEEEREELRRQELARGKAGKMFAEPEVDAFSAAHRLRQMEKYLIPGLTAVLSVLLVVLGIRLFLGLSSAPVPMRSPAAVSALAMAMISALSFFLSRYTAGMARQASWRLLQAGAGYMAVNALAAFAAAVSLVFIHAGYFMLDAVVARVIIIFLPLLGLELIVNLILEFYRPRQAGEDVRPGYESRMLALLVEPAAVMKTVSDTLDYQFGFRISESWFYRFMERAIAPLVLFQILALWLLSCVVIVDTGEQGVIERYGKLLDKDLSPGIHLKRPWPMERARIHSTGKIRRIVLGHGDGGGEGNGHEHGERARAAKTPQVMLWTEQHRSDEYLFLVAQVGEEGERATPGAVPVNVMSAEVEVDYRIADLRKYLYEKAQPEHLLEILAEREIVRFLAGADFITILTSGRQEMVDELRGRIQARAEEESLGLEIVSVSMTNIHPPVGVGAAFEEVASAVQEKEAAILEADAYMSEVTALARGEEAELLHQARAYLWTREKISEGNAVRFREQLKAYRQAPRVYMAREYLQALEEALDGPEKYLIALDPETDYVIILGGEKARSGLLDIMLPGDLGGTP